MAIILHGEFGNTFQERYEINVKNATEAVRCLGNQVSGFLEYIRDHDWEIFYGDEQIDEQSVELNATGRDIHFIPVISGAGGNSGGIAKIIGGVALMLVSFGMAAPLAGGLGATAFSIGGTAVTYGNIATFGLMLAFMGVSALLTPKVKKEKKQDSFIFGNVENNAEQGQTIPWVWGTTKVGTTLISAGITSTDISLDSSYPTVPDTYHVFPGA